MAEWYYIDSQGAEAGPLGTEEIRGLLTNGIITADTLMRGHDGQMRAPDSRFGQWRS